MKNASNSEKHAELWKTHGFQIVNNMKSIAKPFVQWVGGKTRLLSSIEETLPSNFKDRKNITYIEPFVGGGAVMFYLLQKYPNISKAYINDINRDLTITYSIIKSNPYELIELLSIIQNEYLSLNLNDKKEYFLNKRSRYNENISNELEIASLIIFLQKTCFNGLYRVNSKGKYNTSFGQCINPLICDKETILADSDILQRVEILNGDYSKTLDYATENSFFYFDPPYKPLNKTSNFTSYSKENFNDLDQINLSNFCKEIHKKGHNFILSNSDISGDFFNELYSSFKMNKVFINRMVSCDSSKRGKITELLINNF